MDALEDGASDQDDVQYVGEQNSKSSKKGGRPPDSVREHFTDTGAKDSIKKRAPCKCNYCSQQFTASTAEVATLRDHILHKCKHAPAAARQQLLQQQAQTIDPAAASASAALLAAGGSKRRCSSSFGSSSVQLGIGQFCAGSRENALLPGSIARAQQHLTRSIVCNNLPFRVLDCPHLHQFIHELKPGFPIPSVTCLRTRLLAHEYGFCLLFLVKKLNTASNLTVSADGWSDRLKRGILGITVVFPDGAKHLLRAIDLGAADHTAEEIAKRIVEVLDSYKIKPRVAMLVTDNASAMAKARALVVASEGLQHVIPFRCCMHAFALLLGSVVSHSWASGRVTKAQKIVTYFNASHKPLALFRAALAEQPGSSKAGLVTSNTTRLTSTQLCVSSVLKNQWTFASMLAKPGGKEAVRNVEVLELVQDLHFFGDLRLLDAVLQPISWVIMAVQRQTTTLADVARYWHYLARQLGEAVKQLPDVEYQQHIINAFHQRAKEMDVGLLKLALFLSPRYRQAALKTSDSSAAGSSSGSSSGSAAARQAAMLKLQSVAGKLAQKLGYTRGEVETLFSQMEKYAANVEPYDQDGRSPRTYWADVLSVVTTGAPATSSTADTAAAAAAAAAGAAGQLPPAAAAAGQLQPAAATGQTVSAGAAAAGAAAVTVAVSDVQLLTTIALKLLDIKPSAAAPEQVFSHMGYFHSKERNSLNPETNEMETVIKLHWNSFAPVKVSSTEQQKRAQFDSAVEASLADANMADPAQLPDDLQEHVDRQRQAAQALNVGDRAAAEEEEAVTAEELSAELSRLRTALQPPAGFSSWTDAVRDAFDGWDFGSNLMESGYREQYVPPVLTVRPPTTGDFSVEELLQRRQQQLAQQVQYQQQLLLQAPIQQQLPGYQQLQYNQQLFQQVLLHQQQQQQQ